MTREKENAGNSDDPRIDFIDPSSVKQNDEVPLSIFGANFRDGNFVLIAEQTLSSEFISDKHLKVQLTTAITGSPGDKYVKVHDVETGALSNEKTLTVEPASN